MVAVQVGATFMITVGQLNKLVSFVADRRDDRMYHSVADSLLVLSGKYSGKISGEIIQAF